MARKSERESRADYEYEQSLLDQRAEREPPTHGTMVVTYQTTRGLKFSLCRPCARVLRAEDNWPGDSSGPACNVHFGLHYGCCGCHRHNQIAAAAQAESR